MSLAGRITAEVRAIRLAIGHLLAALFIAPYSMRRCRAMCYKLGGADIQLGSEICGGVRMTGHTVSLGKGAFIGAGTLLEANTDAMISIGNNVAIGPGTSVLTSTHEIGSLTKRAGRPLAKAVTIEDGAWIGAGVTILPGITIGRGAVVAAGTTVHKDVVDSVLLTGQPARTVRVLGGEL